MKHPTLWITASVCLTMGQFGLAAENSPFASQDWPRYRGAFDTGVVAAPGPLIDDLAQAKLLWISEERNLPLGWGLGHGGSNKARTTMRGSSYSGPVVANGKVFLQYSVPHGEIRIETNDKGGSFDPAKTKDPRPESWAMAALDMILCLDASTGKTLWKTELPGGTSFNYSRNETFQHPCVVDGVLYAQGTGGRAHAVKVADGSVIWTAELGPGTKLWDEYREKSFAEKKAIWGGQVFNVSPNWIDGVICFNDQTHQTGRQKDSGLVALDAKTGKLLWAKAEVMGRLVSPTFCRLGDTVAVIAVSSDNFREPGNAWLRGFELRTGKLLWELQGTFSNAQTPCAWNDRLLVSTVGVRGGPEKLYHQAKDRKQLDPDKVSLEQYLATEPGWRCFKLSADKPPTEIWSLPINYAGGNASPVYRDGNLFVQTCRAVLRVDANTGQILAQGPKIDHHLPFMVSGDRLIQYGSMYDITDPKTITKAGAITKTEGWTTIVYAHSCVAGGRLYIRGWITDETLRNGDAPEQGAIACFDLRKQP